MTHSDEKVKEVVTEWSVPVKKDMWADRGFSREKKALWTPNFLFLDREGEEWTREQGHLPPNEYISRFLLEAGKTYMQTRELDRSETCLDTVLEDYEDTHFAPEACYYRGVCRMRQTKDVSPLYDACREVIDRWPDHIMAEKLAFTERYENFDSVGQ